MDKILSIIVPSYNMEAYLPKCLGSLVIDDEDLLQKLDVIVVNDGSKDRTSAIAHEFETRYPGVFRVIDKENGNYGSCVNAGLKVARGVYVRLLDADDYVYGERFEHFLQTIIDASGNEASRVDLFISDYATVDPEGRVICETHYGLPTGRIATLDDCPPNMLRLAVQSVVYKLENILNMNYCQSEGLSYTDTEWVIEPMITVKSLRYINEPVSCYLIGRNGQTMENRVFAERFGQIISIAKGLISRYEDRCSQCVPQAENYYKRMIMGIIEMVYTKCLWGLDRYRVAGDLKAFDDYLKSNEELYFQSDGLKVKSRWFRFRYVHEWRKRKSKHSLPFFGFSLYLQVQRLINQRHLS